jgi:hypothetical protein
VITPERPQRVRREVQLFRNWLVEVAPLDGSENRSRPAADN